MGMKTFGDLIHEGDPIPGKAIDAELARRLSFGFDFDFGDARGVHHFNTTEDDMKRWMQEVTPLAQVLLNGGQTSYPILIKTATGPVTVTPVEWQSVLQTAALIRQPLFQGAFALKAMDPIPQDYLNDSYWS